MSTTGFFAVGRNSFTAACKLGMNPACAFLVMACGTGKDNTTTRWSAEAVGNHAAIRWSTAKEAIEALCKASLVTKGGKPARPVYKLKKEGDSIWLPRSLVEGAAGETPPVARVRQTQDPMALRLLIELYSAQNLREDGGISTKVTYKSYERRKAGEHGAYTVWDITPSSSYVTWGAVTAPHRREVLTDKEKADGKNPGVDFFRRFDTLKSLGLVEWTPYLYDGPEGEPIHAMAEHGLPIEQELYEAAYGAALRMLPEDFQERLQGIAVPVQSHIAEATLIGIARLRYRPHTNLTAAWWAEHSDVCSRFVEQYDMLVPGRRACVTDASATANQRTGTFDCPF